MTDYAKEYLNARFNFHESLRDNGIGIDEDTFEADIRFDAAFESWKLSGADTEELYGDDFMNPGILGELVTKIVDEYDEYGEVLKS